MEKLYRKINFSGGKLYVPTIRGGHRLAIYRTATGAQTHSQRVRARYLRLKAAEPRASGGVVTEPSLVTMAFAAAKEKLVFPAPALEPSVSGARA